MTTIDNIKSFFDNITLETVIDVWIAIAIILLFRIFSGPLSYIIIKMFKLKEKDSKKIKNNAFYDPLKSFFGFLGLYLAIVFLSAPLGISQEIMNIITKAFKIIIILRTATGLAKSITTKSSFILKLKEKSSKNIDKNTVVIIVKIIKIAIYLFATFLVITELGYNLNGLITGLGIGSVVITLAAQDTAKNLIGGVTIFLDRPFKIGDFIKVGEFQGTVEDITFRSTRVRTLDNSVLYIPNAQMSSSTVINTSQKIKNRYRNTIIIERETSLHKVEICKNKIVNSIKEVDGVIVDSVYARITNVSQNGIEMLIDCFVNTTDDLEFLEVKENINYVVMEILKNENINLA